MGTQMGRIKWDVKAFMQSRQDYIRLEMRRDTSGEGDSPGDAQLHRVLQSYRERCFDLATGWQRMRRFGEL